MGMGLQGAAGHILCIWGHVDCYAEREEKTRWEHEVRTLLQCEKRCKSGA